MVFNLKFESVKSIGTLKKESGFILFVAEKLKKQEFDDLLSRFNFESTSRIFNKYKNEESNVIKVNPDKNKTAFVWIYKYKSEKLTSDYFRNELAGALKELSGEEVSDLYILLPNYSEVKEYFSNQDYFYQTAAEGCLLGNYTFNRYKSDKKKTKSLQIKFVSNAEKSIKEGLKSAKKLLQAVNFSKNLVNEPAITLTPSELAKRTKLELTKSNVKVTVFNKKQLKEKKMNAILSVGSATPNDPCLIVMRYQPKTKSKGKIALVGKGVTYDTGGLSIKPTSGMFDMKADMAGAAAVIGIMKAAADFKLPYELIGIVPAVENAISGNAYKPGDIVKTASGKSIEVKDTDAEGRIILADALEYASKQNPDEILDFATLTGSVVVALGEYAAGVFTKDDKLAENLTDAGMRTYERVWRLPFWDDYKKLMKSEIADVSNLGPRWGGAISAGKFLEHFVDEKIPWAHMDIAGVALANDLNNYTKKWHTGFGVRLIVDYLQNR